MPDSDEPDDEFSGMGPFRRPWAEHFIEMASLRSRIGWFFVADGVISVLILVVLLHRYGLPMGDGAAALTVLSPLFFASGGLSLASARLLRRKADREIVRSIMQK